MPPRLGLRWIWFWGYKDAASTVLGRNLNAKHNQTMKLVAVICMIATLFCASCSRAPVKTLATTSQFQSGQVWTFHTPTNELSSAALTVVRVDFDPKEGPIIFVAFTGLRHTFWEATNMFCPFSEDALNRSVISLVQTNAFPTGKDLEDFQSFYNSTRKGVESGQLRKCFKITAAEVLEARRKQELEEDKERDKPWPWWKFWQ
jgi:hypothetical protein